MITGHSQNNVRFEQQNNYYLKGGSLVYGNNILSKMDKRPFNTGNALNDNTKMTYVDIDNDPSTFSSSAVQLNVPENSTIINATLYWAGTYPGAKGKKKREGNRLKYVIVDEVDQDLSKVKIKIDNGDYSEVSGQIVFDASNATEEVLNSNKPYVCKADVTSLITNNQLLSKITVANVPAALGHINGGSTAGWLLFIVYENPNNLPHFISLYDGFEYITDKMVEVNIKDFKTAKVNTASSRITIAALDGDSPLKKDHIKILNPKTGKKHTLSSKTRPELNFFNSNIDNNKDQNDQRFPSSKNTLGFDIAQVDIIDQKGSLIPSSTENLNIQYATKADSFYVFFTAFQTQIDEDYLEKKELENIAIEPTEAYEVEEVLEAQGVEGVAEVTGVEGTNKVIHVKEQTTEEETIQEVVEKTTDTAKTNTSNSPQEIANVSIPENTTEVTRKIYSNGYKGPLPGYYVITNAFRVDQNVEDWKAKLVYLGFDVDTFYFEQNGLVYIYIAYDKYDKESLKTVIEKARKFKILEETWVKKID